MRKILTIIPFVVGEDLRSAHATALRRDAADRGPRVLPPLCMLTSMSRMFPASAIWFGAL
jgi:hypothetical protein